jgi:carbonic anhydrase
MSLYTELLDANRRYAASFDLGGLPMPPARKLAILACMDARMTVEEMLGLDTGDAHIIRNAGGLATEDALRSLIISWRLLGTREFLVINHTDCGMLTFRDEELRANLQRETGADSSGLRFHAFADLEQNVRRQVETIRRSPFIPAEIPIRGLLYDVRTGKLNEVLASAGAEGPVPSPAAARA